MICLLLVIIMTIQLTTPSYAAESPTHCSTTIWSSIDKDSEIAQQLDEYDGTLFYSYVDKNISYCAQKNANDEIQFSYIIAGNETIFVGDLVEIKEICNEHDFHLDSSDFKSLNELILNNLNDYKIVSELSILNQADPKGYSNLNDAIEAAFGSNYSGKYVDDELHYHNLTYYRVRCTESQTTSYTTPNSMWFAAGTVITAITAWLMSNNWDWVNLGISLVTTVVTTALVNGVRQTTQNLTVQRSDVSQILTRIITVDGYSGTQYWAGWTRKIYFLKGDLGWTHDTSYHYNIKQADYDNVPYLLQHGFDLFVNS